MKIHRFYLKQNINPGSSILVEDEGLVHQWLHVFRFQVGDKVNIFNQSVGEWNCSIVDIKRGFVTLNAIELVSEPEKIVQIPVYIAPCLIKQDNLELVLQKATEIGIDGVFPIIGERSQYKKYNLERANKVLIEATEQSGRIRLPILGENSSLVDFCEKYEKESNIIVLSQLGTTVGEIVAKHKELENAKGFCVLVGPEGGWSDKELSFFEEKKYAHLKLGEHTLRAETASILGSFVAKYYLVGDSLDK